MKTAGKSEAHVVDALRQGLVQTSIDKQPLLSELETANAALAEAEAARDVALGDLEVALSVLTTTAADLETALAALQAIVDTPREEPDPPSTFGLYDALVDIAQGALDALSPEDEGEAP